MNQGSKSSRMRIESQQFEASAITSEEIKNQYSTFIEELEQTTEQLMNQVFNADYKPQVQKEEKIESVKKKTRPQKKFISTKRQSKVDSQGFENFMMRNNKWQERKKKNYEIEVIKKKELIDSEITSIPQILRGSREKLDPIYQRSLEIQHTREQARKFKEIDQRKKEEQKFKSFSFHPQINSRMKNRTIEEYLKDKETWEEKKLNSRKTKKIHQEAKKYQQCIFKPVLISKQIDKRDGSKKGEKVEERLLKTLQKSFDQLMG